MTDVEFFFDFGSPTAYLANCRLRQLQDEGLCRIVYQPMLLGGVFKAAGSMSPIAVPAKGKYMNEQDLPRFAKRYGVPLNFNPFFPINTLTLMRGAYASRELNCEEAYIAAAFQAMWVDGKNMGDPEEAASTLDSAGLDSGAILALTAEPHIKQQLIANTELAVSRGAFGAPTMYLGEEMFFGQDRLDFVEERLRA